jgi:hypothetical protein
LNGFPALPEGRKDFVFIAKLFAGQPKPFYFRIGLCEAFFASPVVDKLKRVHIPGRLTR